VRYSDRLADNHIVASVGSKGDSYDNAMVESFSGRYKWELIYKQGPGFTTPAAFETAHYSQIVRANPAGSQYPEPLPNPGRFNLRCEHHRHERLVSVVLELHAQEVTRPFSHQRPDRHLAGDHGSPRRGRRGHPSDRSRHCHWRVSGHDRAGLGDRRWPAIFEKVMAADILVIGSAIWLGEKTSVATRVIERL
jgi:transposase InsO family protein